jgi:hypothetical protein
MRALLEQLHVPSGGYIKPEDLVETSAEMHGLPDSRVTNDNAGKSVEVTQNMMGRRLSPRAADHSTCVHML